jgi:hypothetical protein
MATATASQMLPAIGQTVRAQFEDLTIDVRVSDVKSSYGRVRLLVSPVSGTGQQWIEVSRLRAAADVEALYAELAPVYSVK